MNDKIKIIFMGCPEFAADILSNLFEDPKIEVIAIYTRPPAVNRRGNENYHHPVADTAIKKYNFPEEHIHWPYSFKSESDFNLFKSYKCDFVCVAAYGLIIPKSILDLHPGKFLNVHASLLPKWRGAAPMMRAIMDVEEEEVGFSIMQMTEGMDEGDYCNQKRYKIDDRNLDQLYDLMAPDAAQNLIKTMTQVLNGKDIWIKQNWNSKEYPYAEKVEKRELRIKNWDTAVSGYRRVLASCESAPSKIIIANKSVTLIAVVLHMDLNLGNHAVVFKDDKLYLGFGDNGYGSIEVISLKPDGKNIMDAKSFIQGIQNYKNIDLVWEQNNL